MPNLPPRLGLLLPGVVRALVEDVQVIVNSLAVALLLQGLECLHHDQEGQRDVFAVPQ